ncbi:MAG: aldo/keto reductase, partial [Acidobacteriota bacterium]
DDLVRSGKIRYIGCSNYYGWQISRANGIAERRGLQKFISGQHLYNLMRRDIEREVLPACAAEGMGMLCWSPLGGGMLTGKYRREEKPAPESRVGLRADIDLPRYWNEASFKILDEVLAVARETGKTPAQVALSWLLQDRRVTAVIVGVRTLRQIEDSLVAGDWDLTEEQRQRLTDVVPFVHGYPRDWIDLTWGNIAGMEEFKPWEISRDPSA